MLFDFIIYASPFFSHFFFALLCVSVHLFVFACLAVGVKKKKKNMCIQWPLCHYFLTEKVMRPVLSGRSGHPHILKYWGHCLLHPDPVWENHSHLALCQAGCSHVYRAVIRKESRDAEYTGASVESQIKGPAGRADRCSSYDNFLFFCSKLCFTSISLRTATVSVSLQQLFHLLIGCVIKVTSYRTKQSVLLRWVRTNLTAGVLLLHVSAHFKLLHSTLAPTLPYTKWETG